MAADKWIARTVGTLIAICVIIMFVSHPIAALVGLIGIFITESAVGCFSGRWYLRLNRRTDSSYLSFVAFVLNFFNFREFHAPYEETCYMPFLL